MALTPDKADGYGKDPESVDDLTMPSDEDLVRLTASTFKDMVESDESSMTNEDGKICVDEEELVHGNAGMIKKALFKFKNDEF